MKVLIADDHNLLRAGLVALLSKLPGMETVWEAADGREALRVAKEQRPDIVIMDIDMPGLNGLDATERIREAVPDTKVLILSMHTKEEFVAQALRAGAAGYLLKGAATDELAQALKVIGAGQFYFSPDISRQVADIMLHGKPTGLEVLSTRQREILQLVAEGHTTRAIADRLHVSTKTVDAHRAEIMKRLDIHDVAGLVRFAIRKGLVKSY